MRIDGRLVVAVAGGLAVFQLTPRAITPATEQLADTAGDGTGGAGKPESARKRNAGAPGSPRRQ